VSLRRRRGDKRARNKAALPGAITVVPGDQIYSAFTAAAIRSLDREPLRICFQGIPEFFIYAAQAIAAMATRSYEQALGDSLAQS